MGIAIAFITDGEWFHYDIKNSLEKEENLIKLKKGNGLKILNTHIILFSVISKFFFWSYHQQKIFWSSQQITWMTNGKVFTPLLIS